MDMTLSDAHRTLIGEVRSFIEKHKHLSPRLGGGRKVADTKTLAWQRLLIEHGYAARTVPKEYGGFGKEADLIENAIIAEEFARAEVCAEIKDAGTALLVPTLLEAGSPAQRRQWIKPTIMGEIAWCQGYSEPDSGSDLASLRTKAVVEGDSFVINGRKIWTTSAQVADMMFLLCRTEDDASSKGLSYLLLPMKTPGIHIRPIKTMVGQASFNEVTFDNVRLPVDQIVGRRGEGWTVANQTLRHERLLLGGTDKLIRRVQTLQAIIRDAAFDQTTSAARRDLIDRLMRLEAEVMAVKYQFLRLLTQAARGEEVGVGGLIMKYLGSTLAFRISELGADVYGLAGLRYDLEAGDHRPSAWCADYMYDLGLVIGGGSSQIQKNIIAERGLGLPREPRSPTKAGGHHGV